MAVEPQATRVPAPVQVLADKLEQRAHAAAKRKPAIPGRWMIGDLEQGLTNLSINFDTEKLLDFVTQGGPGNKQEGVLLKVDGRFTFTVAEKVYHFRLSLSPAWMRVDMEVGK